ncbi:unnamed protein product [Diabrotica balteata]|uniref:Uncharacterized protein n=1 Tax=Diabrotica balteata TaxID=107213 RepID=A0A9P0GUA1_DIABA|nr:unnamed protein product [Diabrotica balteata]
MIKNLTIELQELKTDIKEVKTEQKQYREEMRELKTEEAELKQENSEIWKENEQIKKDLIDTKGRLERLDKIRKENNVIIQGMTIEIKKIEKHLQNNRKFYDKRANYYRKYRRSSETKR